MELITKCSFAEGIQTPIGEFGVGSAVNAGADAGAGAGAGAGDGQSRG